MKYSIKYTALLLTIFIFTSVTSFAQKNIRIKKKDFELENTGGFKLAWKNIKDGDDFFEKGTGYFDEALEHYKMAARYNKTHPGLNYKMGVCYLSFRKHDKAIEAFNTSLAGEEQVAVDVFYLLARAYHLSYQFENAVRNYQKCLEADMIKELDMSKQDINILIRQCNNGKELVKNPVRVNVINLGEAINSEYNDYGPVLHPDHSTLYFTSRRKHEDNDKRWPGDGKYYSDIFMSYKENGKWQPAVLVPKDIYSDNNDAVLEITKDP